MCNRSGVEEEEIVVKGFGPIYLHKYRRSLDNWLDYLRPNFSSTRGPCSSHSCFVIHMFSLSAIYEFISADLRWSMSCRDINMVEHTILASTAPPKKTICLRRGGSSIRTLNFCSRLSAVPTIPNNLNLHSTSPGFLARPSLTIIA